jgi:hypothetical protein
MSSWGRVDMICSFCFDRLTGVFTYPRIGRLVCGVPPNQLFPPTSFSRQTEFPANGSSVTHTFSAFVPPDGKMAEIPERTFSPNVHLGVWRSARVPPGGKMAESRSMGLNHFSAFVPPDGKMAEV